MSEKAWCPICHRNWYLIDDKEVYLLDLHDETLKETICPECEGRLTCLLNPILDAIQKCIVRLDKLEGQMAQVQVNTVNKICALERKIMKLDNPIIVKETKT